MSQNVGLFHFGIGLAVNSCIVLMDLASTGGGGGLLPPPKPQLLNCNDRTEPGNFREVIISSGMWEV